MLIPNELIRIICPTCLMKQVASLELDEDTPFIQCGYSKCRHLITGHEIDRATRQTIKSPTEIKKYRI